MLIDWFTVIAQVVNFLVLVWLLKRFLYRPILNAIDKREKRIAKELADADGKKAESDRARDEFQKKNEEFDKQRTALLNKAIEEANAERKRFLEEARKAAEALSTKQQETLRNDARKLGESLRLRTQQEVFAITRKTLCDLASTSLEECLVAVFIRRVREMDAQMKECLAVALKTAPAPALVRSAFDLPSEQRAAIQNALNETITDDIHLRFETAPELISGIELTMNGQRVGWSIANYLALMEEGIEDLLRGKDKPEVKAVASSDLTPQIAKRAYELYEQRGHKSESAIQDWSQAEREIRTGESKVKPKTEDTKPESKSL